MDAFPDPIVWLLGLSAIALLPFLAVMTTAFVKLVVVLMLLRNALGIQQIPPNIAINALALILSAYIMAPIGTEIHERLVARDIDWSRMSVSATQATLIEGVEPLRRFLHSHADPRELAFFVATAKSLWPPSTHETIGPNHWLILIPAFTTSELKSAIQIGFLLYLPFIAIDLIVSNVLLAMGMMMVSPMTISLPFKLLLFSLADGWTRLIHGLAMSYQ